MVDGVHCGLIGVFFLVAISCCTGAELCLFTSILKEKLSKIVVLFGFSCSYRPDPSRRFVRMLSFVPCIETWGRDKP